MQCQFSPFHSIESFKRMSDLLKADNILFMGIADPPEMHVCLCRRKVCRCLPSITLGPQPQSHVVQKIHNLLAQKPSSWSKQQRAFLKKNNIDCRIAKEIFTSKLPYVGNLLVNFAMPTICHGKAFVFAYYPVGTGHFVCEFIVCIVFCIFVWQ